MINQTQKYRGLLESGKRISKTDIEPYGLYKISTYNYVDKGRTTLKGVDETLIFVTGIYERKVSALKLSNIPPVQFLNWFKKIARSNDNDVLNEDRSNIRLSELAIPMDMGGNKIYDSYIRNYKGFVEKGAAYRTYKLDGIQFATEVFLKKNVLEQYYG